MSEAISNSSTPQSSSTNNLSPNQDLSLNPNKRPNAKHVSRACLECRHRHVKCDGQEPKCTRCVQHNKECSYVKSNRGGSRKKGVKKAKLNSSSSEANDHSNNSQKADDLSLPCVAYGKVKPCPNGHDKKTCGFQLNKDIGSLPCQSSENSTTKLKIENDNPHVAFSAQKFMEQNFNIVVIIQNYYNSFHNSHPVLPPLGEIDQFLQLTEYPKELLGIMKVLGDGFTTSKYAKNINEIFDVATELTTLINSKPRDVISLQSLILLSLICHISALHDLSASLRKQAIELSIHLDINNLDIDSYVGKDINGNINQGSHHSETNGLTPTGSVSQEININFYNTKRVRNLPDHILKNSARRCFWELFFLDIIIGSSDGKTLSQLTSLECFVKFPSVPHKYVFDYETRSCTSKLVDESVRLNNIIFSEKSIGNHYTKLTAALSNWELKFSNPDFYKLPYLIDSNGTINEGIQQGLVMLNYAKIFTHRPLSFLWRSDLPKNLKCVELLNDQLNKSENCEDIPNEKDLINSRKIIETRKTIDAANSIAKTLIDTNPTDIMRRTPLNACSLAFAGLVHLSAYLWSSQIVQNTENSNVLSSSDLNIYEEYMKLELSGIYRISANWYLSSKIANYLMESISKLVPDLYVEMQSHFKHHNKPNIQTAARPHVSHAKSYTVNSPSTVNSGNSLANNSTTTDLSKVFEAPSGFLDSGMSYNLPVPIAQVDSPTSNITSSIVPAVDEPVSPASDTGCDWIDKNQLDFDFTGYNFSEFDFESLNSIDEIIKNASTTAV